MQTRRPRNQDLVLGALRAAPGQALTAYEILALLEKAGDHIGALMYIDKGLGERKPGG